MPKKYLFCSFVPISWVKSAATSFSSALLRIKNMHSEYFVKEKCKITGFLQNFCQPKFFNDRGHNSNFLVTITMQQRIESCNGNRGPVNQISPSHIHHEANQWLRWPCENSSCPYSSLIRQRYENGIQMNKFIWYHQLTCEILTLIFFL